MKKKKKKKSKRRREVQQHQLSATIAEALELATALHQQGRLEEAEGIYRTALESSPDHVDALHFLGVLLHQRGQSGEAERLICRAIALAPEYVDAHNNLGNVLMEQLKLEEAETAYRDAIAIDDSNANSHSNLGVILRGQGKYDEALAEYQRAIELDDAHADAYHNLGNLFQRTGKTDEALTAFQKAVELRPYHSHTYDNLGKALYRADRIEEAEDVYRRWLKNDPKSAVAKHMLAACTGEDIPERASDSYVSEHFDGFAKNFDEVLDNLGYCAPQLVAAEVANQFGQPDGSLDILDAGCGTGWNGPLLRPYARRLVGIDLSNAMLARARRRKVYDELLNGELTAHLQSQIHTYHLIVLTDTFIYFGNLQPAIDAAATALIAGGRFAFSLEAHEAVDDADSYKLHPHGRYSHTEMYVEKTLGNAGFVDVRVTADVIRKECGEPVSGWIVSAGTPC